MSDLTAAQIACFDRFAKRVEDYLNANSRPSKDGRRSIVAKVFDLILTICFRPTALAPVMHNGEALKVNGRTKRRFQLRFPEKNAKGEPHPQAGQLMFDWKGNARYSKAHAQMFTAKAFREWRAEQTGLKTPETAYFVAWDKLSESRRKKLAAVFPPKRDGKPEFVPQVVALLLRKGNKPAKGEKRHSWQRMFLLVIGHYGEFGTCVIPNAAVWESGCIEELGIAIGCPTADIPVWTEEEDVTPLAKAANSVLSVQDHGIDFDF